MNNSNNKFLLDYVLLIALFGVFYFEKSSLFGIISLGRAAVLVFVLFFFIKYGPFQVIQSILKVPFSFHVLLLITYLYLRNVISGSGLYDQYFFILAINIGLMFLVFIMPNFQSFKPLVVHGLVVISCFISAVTFYFYGVGPHVQDFRVGFPYIGLNEYSSLLMISFAFQMLYFYESFEEKSILSLFLVGLASIFIIYSVNSTGSRIAILGVILILLVFLLFSFLRSQWSFFFTTSIIGTAGYLIEVLKLFLCDSYNAIGISATSVINSEGCRSSPIERFDLVDLGVEHNISSGGGRFESWSIAIDSFYRNPFFGLGHFGFKDFTLESYGKVSLPLNAFLEVAAVGGVCGILLLFFIISRFLKVVIQTNAYLPAVVIFVPLALMTVTFNIGFSKFFWVYLGVSLSWIYSVLSISYLGEPSKFSGYNNS